MFKSKHAIPGPIQRLRTFLKTQLKRLRAASAHAVLLLKTQKGAHTLQIWTVNFLKHRALRQDSGNDKTEAAADQIGAGSIIYRATYVFEATRLDSVDTYIDGMQEKNGKREIQIVNRP